MVTRKKEAKAKRVVGYCRVSTEEQAQEGVSLDAQRAKIVQYAEVYDLELIDVFIDAGLSGKSLDRPGLQQALVMLPSALKPKRKPQADGIVVVKLDRLTRRLYDLGDLMEEFFKDGGAHLLSVNEQIDTRTAGGRLMLHILASVAEWEREAIGERVRDALAHLRAQGVKLGAQALGWERGEELDGEGRLVVQAVRSEMRTIERIIELRASGKSLREIADVLEKERRPTKRGGRWQAQTVALVLSRASEEIGG